MGSSKKKHSYRLVIFDLDGTLADSYPAIIASVNATLKQFGKSMQSAAAIRRAVGRGDKALLAGFFETKEVGAALPFYRIHHACSLQKKSYLMPYAEQILSFLHKKKYKLAIASNRPARFTDIILRHLKIKRYFDAVLCKDQIRFGKPHPSMINKIRKRLGVSRNETLYIGDMVIDVRTAQRAHVNVFAVATGSNTFGELKKQHPTFLARSLGALSGRI